MITAPLSKHITWAIVAAVAVISLTVIIITTSLAKIEVNSEYAKLCLEVGGELIEGACVR